MPFLKKNNRFTKPGSGHTDRKSVGKKRERARRFPYRGWLACASCLKHAAWRARKRYLVLLRSNSRDRAVSFLPRNVLQRNAPHRAVFKMGPSCGVLQRKGATNPDLNPEADHAWMWMFDWPEQVADLVARAPALLGRRQGQCCGRG